LKANWLTVNPGIIHTETFNWLTVICGNIPGLSTLRDLLFYHTVDLWEYSGIIHSKPGLVNEISGYGIIPFHPLKYPRSKQDIKSVYIHLIHKSKTSYISKRREYFGFRPVKGNLKLKNKTRSLTDLSK